MRDDFTVGDTAVRPGSQVAAGLPITDLSTHRPITRPLQVVHGRQAGPPRLQARTLRLTERRSLYTLNLKWKTSPSWAR